MALFLTRLPHGEKSLKVTVRYTHQNTQKKEKFAHAPEIKPSSVVFRTFSSNKPVGATVAGRIPSAREQSVQEAYSGIFL